MSKIFVEKNVRKIIAQKMSKSQRKALAEGETFIVHIHRHGKELKKWGYDNNNCHIQISGKNMAIYYNNLEEVVWGKNSRKIANDAISYFLYGGKEEYEMVVCAINNPSDSDCESEAEFRTKYEH